MLTAAAVMVRVVPRTSLATRTRLMLELPVTVKMPVTVKFEEMRKVSVLAAVPVRVKLFTVDPAPLYVELVPVNVNDVPFRLAVPMETVTPFPDKVITAVFAVYVMFVAFSCMSKPVPVTVIAEDPSVRVRVLEPFEIRLATDMVWLLV